MTRVLVTGGCGYIGSHTLVELIEDGIDAVSLDNNVRSDPSSMDGVRAITGHDVDNWQVDLRDEEATDATFAAIGGIDAVIHFAAFKSVGESVREPLWYYDNNVRSLVNVLRSAERHGARHVVFSSSCSVYGNVDTLPVTEETALGEAESWHRGSQRLNRR